MKASFTTQCVHLETNKLGCWIYSGDNHRTPGTSLSPVFPDLFELFRWMRVHDWRTTSYGECEKKDIATV